MIDIDQWDWHDVRVSFGVVSEACITHLFDLPDYIHDVTIRKYPYRYYIAYHFFTESGYAFDHRDIVMVTKVAERVVHAKFEENPSGFLQSTQLHFDFLKQEESRETTHAL